jgi:predicted RNase H-like nuclease (RuvC/YqgF family)
MDEYNEYISGLKDTIKNQDNKIKLYEKSTSLDYKKIIKLKDEIKQLESYIYKLEKTICELNDKNDIIID